MLNFYFKIGVVTLLLYLLLPHRKLSTKWCVSTWMGDHLGTVSGWSAEHCGVTGQCKDSGVGNRGTHLFLCNGKEMSLCPACTHASCKTTHHLSHEKKRGCVRERSLVNKKGEKN